LACLCAHRQPRLPEDCQTESLPVRMDLYHYLKHLQRFRFRSEFRTEKLCVTLRLKSARQKYKNVLSMDLYYNRQQRGFL